MSERVVYVIVDNADGRLLLPFAYLTSAQAQEAAMRTYPVMRFRVDALKVTQ